MKSELELEVYKSMHDNIGIHPASVCGKPRDAHGDGWNDAVIRMGDKVDEISKWIEEKNLSEGLQIKIAELLKNDWMMIYAFNPSIPKNFMVNWSDEDNISNLTLEDIDTMYEYFLKDKCNQETWVEEVWRKKVQS